MNEVKFGQRFYEISSHLVRKSKDECLTCLSTCRCAEHWIYLVTPVFVYSKNEHFDGEDTFDVSPVNMTLKKNAKASWRYKYEVRYSEINDYKIFKTKKLAMKKYVERYTDKQRAVYEELSKLIPKQ